MVVDLLLAPSHLLEHIYKEGVLGYDSLNTISLNWVSLLGTATGALLTYQLFALRKWRYKNHDRYWLYCHHRLSDDVLFYYRLPSNEVVHDRPHLPEVSGTQ